MLKNKYIALAAAILIFLSSCGIFKKDCHCPHVSYKAAPKKDYHPQVS